MCRFSSELQREFSSGYSHGDILPSDPRVGLLGVYFLWGTSEVGWGVIVTLARIMSTWWIVEVGNFYSM
jgi:hypothetical protein